MRGTVCAHCRQALRQSLRAPRGAPSSRSTQPANSFGSVTRPLVSQKRQNHTSSQGNTDPDIRSVLSNPAWPCATSYASRRSRPRDARRGGCAPDDATDAAPLRALDPERRHDGRGAPCGDSRRNGAGPARTDDRARDPEEALASEEVVGHSRRPRRRREQQEQLKKDGQRCEAEDWDALAGASETAGRYFVVRSGKGGETQ
ncbi:uncharacterized protein PG998_009180 [Apiospora kogelbergensis]|uniref:uncharacterized protein n=1 Tax=Apiospora kogelbergensis TaxID=1337665 RepID=UPI00312E0589